MALLSVIYGSGYQPGASTRASKNQSRFCSKPKRVTNCVTWALSGPPTNRQIRKAENSRFVTVKLMFTLQLFPLRSGQEFSESASSVDWDSQGRPSRPQKRKREP